MNYFDNIEIENFGKLKIEKIILEANYPVLYISKNEFGERFICACYYNVGMTKKILISQVTPEIIIKMLKDEIPLGTAFVLFEGKRIRYEIENGKRSIYNEKKDWDIENSEVLPAKGEYIESEEDEFIEEIEFYESKIKEKCIINNLSIEIFTVNFNGNKNSKNKFFNIKNEEKTYDFDIKVDNKYFFYENLREAS